MLAVKLVTAVLGILGLLLAGLLALVLFGQLIGSRYGYQIIVLAFILLSVLGAVAKFRIWGRRDKFSKELTDTWGRSRDHREPGVDEEKLTR